MHQEQILVDNVFKVSGNSLITTDWGGAGTFESESINLSGISTIDISAVGETLGGAVQNGSSEYFKY